MVWSLIIAHIHTLVYRFHLKSCSFMMDGIFKSEVKHPTNMCMCSIQFHLKFPNSFRLQDFPNFHIGTFFMHFTNNFNNQERGIACWEFIWINHFSLLIFKVGSFAHFDEKTRYESSMSSLDLGLKLIIFLTFLLHFLDVDKTFSLPHLFQRRKLCTFWLNPPHDFNGLFLTFDLNVVMLMTFFLGHANRM